LEKLITDKYGDVARDILNMLASHTPSLGMSSSGEATSSSGTASGKGQPMFQSGQNNDRVGDDTAQQEESKGYSEARGKSEKGRSIWPVYSGHDSRYQPGDEDL
jgi:hypothetical protein